MSDFNEMLPALRALNAVRPDNDFKTAAFKTCVQAQVDFAYFTTEA